jgi:hypothetical protein
MAARVEALTEERNVLLDRLLASHGARPLHAPARIGAITAIVDEEAGTAEVNTSRLRPSDISSMATKAKTQAYQSTRAGSTPPPLPTPAQTAVKAAEMGTAHV